MSYDAHCNGCPYHKQQHLSSTQTTSRISPPIELEENNSNTLLVFQAPGDDEWRIGKAIQPTIKQGGSAGRRVASSWARCNKKRSDFDIINTVQCYPGNQGERDISPNIIAICSCSKRLENTLQTKSYNKIIAFGDVAYQVISSIYKQNSVEIICGKHPNGGVLNNDLDALW